MRTLPAHLHPQSRNVGRLPAPRRRVDALRRGAPRTGSGALAYGLAALLAVCLGTGCKTPQGKPSTELPYVPLTNFQRVATGPFDPGWLQPSTNLFRLGPGDQLDIEVIGDPTSRALTTVGPDGKIYFYLLPGLDVWGRTLTEAKDAIEGGLKEYFRETQHVAITLRIVESPRIWLLGRLTTPGVYPMTGPQTLLEAIALAGGPAAAGQVLGADAGAMNLSEATEDSADLRRSFVIRGGRMLPVDFQRLLRRGDTTQNIYLQPGDFVYVPSASAQMVHVLGAVWLPRAVAHVPELTLVQAIARSGGTAANAYLSHVAIVRGSLTAPQITIVDYKSVLMGKVPDVLLEPKDIVFVPLSPYRTITRYTDMILQTFVRTVGVNLGARMVDSEAQPVNVNVPVSGATPSPPIPPVGPPP